MVRFLLMFTALAAAFCAGSLPGYPLWSFLLMGLSGICVAFADAEAVQEGRRQILKRIEREREKGRT
jgi:hypothetical protein